LNSITNNFLHFERRSGSERRQENITIFSKYWLTGKRASLRRNKDRQRPHRIERHSSKTFAAILFIVLLSIFDAIFTLDLVSQGAVELNPVMAYYLRQSPFLFFGVKYLLTCAAIVIILLNMNTYLFKTKVKAKTLFFLFAIFFVLVIQWEIYLILL
jgi:hypothetical protein